MSEHASDLFSLLGKFSSKNTLPPVEQWHPDVVGDIDIVIKADGKWFHEGGYFTRQDLARMFASVLRREGDDYFLVTPVEKLKICVEDVPFIIVLMETVDDRGVQTHRFITSLGDEVAADEQHRIEFRALSGQEARVPYIEIRSGLWAKFNQSTYYQLMNSAIERSGPNGAEYIIDSGGMQFVVPTD